MIFSSFGGLAFFLFGMIVMSERLGKLAGGKLEKLLSRLTSSVPRSIILGAGITAVTQSSSAVTVMVVGLVSSGVMTLERAFGVIIGSNIGTTVTSWILSLSGLEGESFIIRLLKPESFAPLAAFIGILLNIFGKAEKLKDTGLIMLGFSLLMYGMELMKSSPRSDKYSERFSEQSAAEPGLRSCIHSDNTIFFGFGRDFTGACNDGNNHTVRRSSDYCGAEYRHLCNCFARVSRLKHRSKTHGSSAHSL